MVGLFSLFRNQIDRRRHPRHAVITTAWIRIEDSTIPFVCVLWDVSEGGAKLSAPTLSEIPHEFTLLLSRDTVTGTRCHVIWRASDQIGVEFAEGAHLLDHLMKGNPVRSREKEELC